MPTESKGSSMIMNLKVFFLGHPTLCVFSTESGKQNE